MNHKSLTMNELLILLALGLVAGILSGMVGIGGGIVIVPALIYFLGFSQHAAQGTVLFMFLLPIGILGVFNYWQAGHIDWKVACIMATTFLVGSFAGSKLAISIDTQTLKRVFGAVIFLLSLKMMFGK
ncbi:MAG: sulfite exporter TauE/SafE family protein [Bacteroidetes bacterium]|nr:MAG: sulfite exporter TauE/SafE family protein [Bacteroidota bacterium]